MRRDLLVQGGKLRPSIPTQILEGAYLGRTRSPGESTTPRNGAAGGPRGTATAGCSRRLGGRAARLRRQICFRGHIGARPAPRRARLGAPDATALEQWAPRNSEAARGGAGKPTALPSRFRPPAAALPLAGTPDRTLSRTHTRRARSVFGRHLGTATPISWARQSFCRRTHGTGCTPQPRSDGGRPLH